MVLLLLAAGLAAEVAAFVAVGEQIGFGWAVVLVLGVSALGPLVIRRTGLGVLDRARGRLAGGELPTQEVLDGVVVLLGGIMICVPGFVGDALGLLLMAAPVRRLLIRRAGHRLGPRVARTGGTVVTVGSHQRRGRRPRRPPDPSGGEIGRGPTSPDSD